jgi:hypothetical protein
VFAIIIASARATSFSGCQRRSCFIMTGKSRTWEMDIHLITIEIGIVGITALSALNLIDQKWNVPIGIMHPDRLLPL